MKETLLSIHNLKVIRDGSCILEIPQLEISSGEVLGVIGPNGAGKTTLMMALSGLSSYQSGEIQYKGRIIHPWKDLSFRRHLALVMQAPLLLHTTVEANISAGLRFRQVEKVETSRRVENWAERLSISHLRLRQAQKISGGEAQRVSLARAFVLEPDLLLLDEPFSALDAPTRAQLIADFKILLASTQTTTLLVTHDLDEALALSDRLAVLMDGRLRQVGTPREVFSSPLDIDIARFTGVETIFQGTVTRQRDGCVEIDCGNHQVQANSSISTGARVYICLRPEDIRLGGPNQLHQLNEPNLLHGTIKALVPQGAMIRAIVGGDLTLTALITRASAQESGLKTGMNIQASFPPDAVHLIEI